MGGSTIWRLQFGLVDKVRAELGLATKARDVVSDADVEDEEAPRIAQNDDDGAKKRKWSASMDGDDGDVDEEEDDTATDDDDDGDDVDARWTRWTPEEDDVVVDMRSRGETYAAIEGTQRTHGRCGAGQVAQVPGKPSTGSRRRRVDPRRGCSHRQHEVEARYVRRDREGTRANDAGVAEQVVQAEKSPSRPRRRIHRRSLGLEGGGRG